MNKQPRVSSVTVVGLLFLLILGCTSKRQIVYYNPLTTEQRMNPLDSLVVIERNDSIIISTVPRKRIHN